MSIIHPIEEHASVDRTPHSTRLPLLLIAGIIILTLGLLGCEGEDNPVASDDNSSNWPGLPEITSASYTPPDTTSSQVVSVSALSQFEPYISGDKGFRDIFTYDNRYNVPDYPDTSAVWQHLKIKPGYYVLVDGDQLIEAPQIDFVVQTGPGTSYSLTRQHSAVPYGYVGEFGGHHYYVSSHKMSCRSAYLAEMANARWWGGDNFLNIGSAVEDSFVTSIIAQEIPGERIWLGLFDAYSEGSWHWLDGDDHGYANWAAGEPDGGAAEDYVIKGDGGVWVDVNGDDSWRLYYTMIESDAMLSFAADSTYRFVEDQQFPFQPEYLYPGPCLVLDAAPRIRHVRYYKLMVDGGLNVGGSYSNAYTLRYGVDSSLTASAARTIKGTVGPAFNALSASLSAELTQTFSTSITIRRFTEESKTLTCGGPVAGTQRKFVFWQKCERFELVDSQGNLWSDPDYEIDPVILDHPLNSYIVQTKDF